MKTLDQSYYCGASTTQIIYETIGVYFDRICDQYPDKGGLIVRHQDVRWTYRELQEKVDALAVEMKEMKAEIRAEMRANQERMMENLDLVMDQLRNMAMQKADPYPY